MKKKLNFYEVMQYVAYGYYILLALIFLVAGMYSGTFNYEALLVIIIFSVQAYYRHKLTNLIIGIVLLAGSIFMLLEFVGLGGKTGFDLFVDVMMGLSFFSIMMAGTLIFSYAKLSFKEAGH